MSATRSIDGVDSELKKRLVEILDERQDSRRSCVLVLGEGINVQAARPRGRKAGDGWTGILRSLWEDAGGSPEAFCSLKSTALQWTCLIQLCARARRINLQRAEKSLRTTLCERLKQLEEQRRESSTLYAEILNAGFANIVSFNIDWRLMRHLPLSQRKVSQAARSWLYRRVRVKLKSDDEFDDGMNVWFPYGDVSNPASLELGHSSYDRRLMMFEDYRDDMMKQWFNWSGDYSQWELRPPAEVYWTLSGRIRSWYDLFFLAPLVFVGVSLPLDDWPLWWLLHQRARNFVPFKNDDLYQCPDTFYLTFKGVDTSHLVGRPAGIELVEFETCDALWKFLRETLSRKARR